jgi:acyl-CoA synthetase (AMP-forming)/AMP-acid ligase II
MSLDTAAPLPGTLSQEMAPALHWTSLGDISRENARRFPQRTAIVCGETRLTYPELDDRSTRLAAAMSAAGVVQGDRVAWMGQICHQVMEIFLACSKLGAILCPVNWRLSPDEASFVFDDMTPSMVFWQQDGTEALVGSLRSAGMARGRWIETDGAGEDCYESFLQSGDALDTEVTIDPALPLLVVYTAAFEGKPHGVQLHHEGLLSTAVVRAFLTGVDQDTVYLNATNVYHVGNWDYGMLPTFVFGGTNVFLRRWNPTEALALVAQEKVSLAFLPGPTYQALLDASDESGLDLSTLEPPASVASRVSGYGQTELHGVQIFRALAPGATSSMQGRPSPFAQCRILDEDGVEVSAGQVGEICMRGNVVMSGYVGHAPTVARQHRAIWHRTNDLGRRETDGSITFVGPKGRMLKSGSENIYPVEVEATIAKLAGVVECAVIGYVDDVWDQSVLAIVVAEPASGLTDVAVISHCKDTMASYKKPRQVRFVDALPRTAAGRIDFDQINVTFEGGGYPGGGGPASGQGTHGVEA